MKNSGTMNGGSLQERYIEACEHILISSDASQTLTLWYPDPTYLLKAVQGFQAKGFPIYAISIQVCCYFHSYMCDIDRKTERAAAQQPHVSYLFNDPRCGRENWKIAACSAQLGRSGKREINWI